MSPLPVRSDADASSGGVTYRVLHRFLAIRPEEVKVVLWAWLYLFSLFVAYYMIRPIRDEVGVAGGVNNLPWLFTGTLVSMMVLNPPYAALVAKLPRVRFVSLAYRFFMANLIAFLVLFRLTTGEANIWVGRVFFVWTSVFNLFVVSVFWEFMVDVFNSEQSKRMFGFIAAAATLGGILGGLLTASAVRVVGVPLLLLGAALLLEFAVFAVRHLGTISNAMHTRQAAPVREESTPIGGGVMAGLTNVLRSPYLLNICVYMLLYTILSTFLYFQQAAIVDANFVDRAARTAFFAKLDIMVNALTLMGQLFVTGAMLRLVGITVTLALVPALTVVGFTLLGLQPTMAVAVIFIVARRSTNFVFARPTREVLFTVVSREDKYKAKSFIDTVVYRLGDQIGAWSAGLLTWLSFGVSGIAWAAVPLALAWVLTAWWLGRRHEAHEPVPVG